MWRGGLGGFVKVDLDNSTSCIINLALKRYQRFLQELYSVFDILQVCSLVGCTVFIITAVVFIVRKGKLLLFFAVHFFPLRLYMYLLSIPTDHFSN